MGKRMVLWLVVLTTCGSFCAAAARAEKIDNPAYQDWARFKPGSFVTYKTVTKMEAMTSETEMTQTLKEVTPEKVLIELVTVMTVAGNEMKMPAMMMEHAAKIEKPEPEGEAAEVPKPEEIDKGAEKITVKDKKIETTWVKTKFEYGGTTTTLTVWSSEDIPSGMVKMVADVTGAAASTSEMTLVDFKADKQ